MDCTEFDALEAQAYEAMSAGAAAFCACGADDEITCRENEETWRALRLRPHVLRDISTVDTSAVLLGAKHAMPIMVAPMGRHKLFHDDGEQASALGAAKAGAAFVLATNATVSIETVLKQRRKSSQWFQLYLTHDRSGIEALIERVEAAGFTGLVLTVDQPVSGSSPRAARNPIASSDDIRHVNLPGQPVAATSYDPSMAHKVTYLATWKDLQWLVKRTTLPVVVKGVLRADDAQACIEAGAKAVIVSNHSGRHLDTTIASGTALPQIAAAVGSQAEVYVDGGIRRGTDVVKALALGADAVLLGRPILWGLALDGASGVETVLTHFQTELVRTMALCGAARLSDITADLVATG
jgi:4-hydroxymandelate oxidase